MKNLYVDGQVVLSFEVFPPKTSSGFEGMYRAIGELASFQPGFISVTYGAGGSTRSQSLDIVTRIREEFGIATTAHFTLVGSTVDQIREFLRGARAIGVANIMALRGDPPQGETAFKPIEGGLHHANELVALIRREFPEFGIGVAGYPEKHIEAPSLAVDLENLKRKVDAGGDAIFTQLFYDNDCFYRFRDRCTQMGIGVPIVPGLLPVLSLAQVKRITSLCGSALPESLVRQLEGCSSDSQAQIDVGVEHCARQVEDLLAQGVPGLHFYVLNRSDSTQRILASAMPSRV